MRGHFSSNSSRRILRLVNVLIHVCQQGTRVIRAAWGVLAWGRWYHNRWWIWRGATLTSSISNWVYHYVWLATLIRLFTRRAPLTNALCDYCHTLNVLPYVVLVLWDLDSLLPSPFSLLFSWSGRCLMFPMLFRFRHQWMSICSRCGHSKLHLRTKSDGDAEYY